MKLTQTATLKQDSEWLLVRCPYSEDFVSMLKEEVPSQERLWEKPVWKVQSAHLEKVRELLSKVASAQGWEVLDETSQTREELQELKTEIEQNNLDRHVAAVLAVLPKLPKRAFRLVSWGKETLELELSAYLDNPLLFKELAQASLETYRPTILYGDTHKREFQRTFIVAADERILRALCSYAGVTMFGPLTGYRSNIEYLLVRELTLIQTFENTVAHFTGNDGSYWIGMPFQLLDWDLSGSRKAWQVIVVGEVIYRLLEREKTVEELIDVAESRYVNPGVGNVGIAQRHSSDVAKFVRYMHLEAWFREWGNALVQNDTLKKTFGSCREGWYSADYQHPADKILFHLSWTRQGGPEMARLLGWSKEAVQDFRDRVKHLKEEKVQQVIQAMQSNATALAVPKLENGTIKELLELGAKHSIDLKKSWGKGRLVEVLGSSSNVCEDIIGLTKRLEGK